MLVLENREALGARKRTQRRRHARQDASNYVTRSSNKHDLKSLVQYLTLLRERSEDASIHTVRQDAIHTVRQDAINNVRQDAPDSKKKPVARQEAAQKPFAFQIVLLAIDARVLISKGFRHLRASVATTAHAQLCIPTPTPTPTPTPKHTPAPTS